MKALGRLLRRLGLCALLLTASCGKAPPAPPPGGGPALWRVQRQGLDGWLFGTIHVLPGHVAWRTEKIRQAIGQADRLVLESSEIQDQARTMALFEKMGRTPGLPPIEARLPSAERPALQQIADAPRVRVLSAYEDWAAAMLLSAAAQQSLHLSPADGVEPALIESFAQAGKPVGGLETVARQFSAFDTLPPAAQQRLLVQTVKEAKQLPVLYDRILMAWLRGDLAAIAREDQAGGAPDPRVEQAVLVARNRDWAKAMDGLRGHPFIAVGAAHLTGHDNLIELLGANGYRVTRVQ
ncbi:TraB/GumN family protein [Sphingobium mellinum]|uniref:TraB/GumN family protein n=1 Tax=Sphingobium mellinum TaxID=1387166 RepID=UPI0030ECB6D9